MCLTDRVRIDERLLAMFDLCPPDIGSVSKNVRRCPISLKNRDFGLERISVDEPKWWSKWWSNA
jgi:hypothetical protein